MSAGTLRSLLPWRKNPRDRHEDFFLNAIPADSRNLIANRIREAPDGSVFAVKADTHTPEVMTRHIKELGRFFGADIVRVVDAQSLLSQTDDRVEGKNEERLPYAVLCGFRAKHDQRDAPGIGGHVAALKAAFATFQISAIIREYGFQARRLSKLDPEQAAVAAGLGRLNEKGRLTLPRFGTKICMGDVILTNLPVAPES